MLRQIELAGFKSIREQKLELGKVNVLIGANGAGKSNLVSFFNMLNFMTAGNFQLHVGKAGGADAHLFYGSKTTPMMEASLIFETQAGTNRYDMRLAHAAQDALIFAEERISFSMKGGEESKTLLASGKKESDLAEDSSDNKTRQFIRNLIRRCCCFQFHDTSETAKIKHYAYVEDNRYLRNDGRNLAAFLYLIKNTNYPYYRRIVLTLRQMIPFFDDFLLEPRKLNETQIMLNWKEKDSDMVFGPHQLSDGSLRMMALVTLLLQPPDDMPSLILIDEPELGLHPYAIETLSSLIRQASRHCQVIVATQSAELMDCFEPEEIIVTERPKQETLFRRLKPAGRSYAGIITVA